MLPRIVTFAALIGMAMGAATPSNFARDFKLLQAQQAAEAPKLAESGIVLLHTEPTSNRSFIEIYGSINNSTSPIASRSKSIVRVPGMCGEEKIDCSYDNGPPEDVTKQLIDILYAQTEWTPLASHPSYCLYGNGSRACVSWCVFVVQTKTSNLTDVIK
ncbi:hypothetical protein QBC41DRAFT_392659 [Cercophora samala]|uniref:Uncharacterized protein n=1 Tax=Cercophora samala TaxID=330535 RepID=A0AA39ZEE6_9PEZI|nr:hypothetical protein QBC41DRAFT_392659 [Cercophora samala]